MSFELQIPLQWMHELEDKYHIELYVEMYEEDGSMEFYIDHGYKKEFIGSSFDQVEWELMDRYGY